MCDPETSWPPPINGEPRQSSTDHNPKPLTRRTRVFRFSLVFGLYTAIVGAIYGAFLIGWFAVDLFTNAKVGGIDLGAAALGGLAGGALGLLVGLSGGAIVGLFPQLRWFSGLVGATATIIIAGAIEVQWWTGGGIWNLVTIAMMLIPALIFGLEFSILVLQYGAQRTKLPLLRWLKA